MDAPNAPVGNEFVLVDEELPAADGDPDFVMVDEEPVMMVHPLAIIPYEEPVQAVPLQMVPPLDMVEISSSSTQSSLVNWWEYVDFMSDDEGSTANSFNYASATKKGIREHASRCKTYLSPVKKGVRLSSTASNSPLGKPPRK